MLSIGLCDDESEEREKLRQQIDAYFQEKPQAYRMDFFETGEDLIAAVTSGYAYDVLFLDIYLGPINGIGIAKQIREFDPRCRIIFVTNSYTHAVAGYEVQALHYLLKPVRPETLVVALDRALTSLQHRASQFVQIHNRQGTFRVLLDDLVYVESQARILILHLTGHKEMRYYDRLDALEAQCGAERFLRCHKSFLVNLDYVQNIVGFKLYLESGEELPISGSVQKVRERFAFHAARGI